jgi:hypothetical protein
MDWIAPSERDAATDTLQRRLWAAADQLRCFYFVLANPPFNVNTVDKGAVERRRRAGRRFPVGLPCTQSVDGYAEDSLLHDQL